MDITPFVQVMQIVILVLVIILLAGIVLMFIEAFRKK